jgi:hypothetical protein
MGQGFWVVLVCLAYMPYGRFSQMVKVVDYDYFLGNYCNLANHILEYDILYPFSAVVQVGPDCLLGVMCVN